MEIGSITSGKLMGSNEEESIEQLTAALRAGRDEALAALFSVLRPRLLRIVQFRMDVRVAARVSPTDVLQEAFISASNRLEHFRSREEMPAIVWLRLIVQQQLIDLHRQHVNAEIRDVRREISLDQPAVSAHTSMAMATQLVGKATSPSGALAREEKVAAIEDALNQIEPLDREVIALRHFEELSNAETAQVLGIEVSAASKRYVRALKRMRAVLADAEVG